MKMWWESNKKEDGTEEIVLPKAIQDQLDEAKGLKTKVDEMSTKLSAIDGISTTLQEMRDAMKPKPLAPKAKTTEEEQNENEELSALLLTDPNAAYAKLASRTNAGVMQLAAQNARREVFSDSANDFPYYTGTLKSEIDSILGQQPLHMQSNVDLIKNTYHTVLGRHMGEITEGKIKDRFASAGGGSGRGSGTKDGEGDERKITVITPDIEKAARHTGLKVEDYMALLNQDAEAYL